MFFLLADAGSRGQPLAYLVGHDPRHIGVIGDATVPQIPRVARPPIGPKRPAQRRRLKIGGPSRKGRNTMIDKDTEKWHERV